MAAKGLREELPRETANTSGDGSVIARIPLPYARRIGIEDKSAVGWDVSDGVGIAGPPGNLDRNDPFETTAHRHNGSIIAPIAAAVRQELDLNGTDRVQWEIDDDNDVVRFGRAPVDS